LNRRKIKVKRKLDKVVSFQRAVRLIGRRRCYSHCHVTAFQSAAEADRNPRARHSIDPEKAAWSIGAQAGEGGKASGRRRTSGRR
jgi:hypothetical protein